MRYTFVAGLVLVASVALFAVAGGGRLSLAQEPPAAPGTAAAPTPPPSFGEFILAQATVEELPAGPAQITVTDITMPAATSTQPFTSRGPALLRITGGSVRLVAETAVVQPVRGPSVLVEPVEPPPAPVDGAAIGSDMQVLIPGGVRVQLSNPGTETATLLMVSILPRSEEVPLAGS